MKKIVFAALAAVLLVFAVSCGKAETRDISMYDLSREMLAATKFGEMSYVSSSDDGAADLLANVSDIDYEKVLSFFIAYASDGMGNADEMVVIAVKDAADAEEAKRTLVRHLESRKELYAVYDPTQTEKLGKGEVFLKDNLAVLLVTGDNPAVKAAFDKFTA